jgi:hypothetical protein
MIAGKGHDREVERMGAAKNTGALENHGIKDTEFLFRLLTHNEFIL